MNEQNNFTTETKLLIVQVSSNSYGFELSNVKEIIRMPEITQLPNAPDYIKGLIRLRDNIIPLIDIRKKLGLKSFEQEDAEFFDMLTEREQDHISWVQELKSCVFEHRRFNLTTDPHQCKFGKWYDSYQTKNVLVANYLEKFDHPHKKIHALGKTVVDLMNNNDYTAAMELVDGEAKKELNELIQLFSELKAVVRKSHREFAVIFEIDGQYRAFNADKIEKIIPVSTDCIGKTDNIGSSDYIRGICKINSNLYVILDEKTIAGEQSDFAELAMN